MLACLTAVLLTLPVAARADPLQGTYLGGGIGRRVQFNHHERDRNAWAGTLRFRLDSGEDLLAFCIQLEVGVRAGDRYKSSGPVVDLPNGCQIANLLDRYPGSSADSEDEAAARQLALWSFSDEVDLSTVPDGDAALRDRATLLASEAAAGSCPPRRTAPPNLRLAPESISGPPGKRLALQVSSDEIDAGQTVLARIAGPAIFDNGQQETRVTLDALGTAELGVTGTGPGATTVSVELPYRLDGGTVFAQLDDEAPSQRLVLAESRDLRATAAVEGNWVESATDTPVPASATPTVPSTATTLAATDTVVPSATLPAGSATTSRPTATTPTGTKAATAQASPGAVNARKTAAPAASPLPTAPSPIIPKRLPSTGGGPSPGPGWTAWTLAGFLLCLAWIGWRRSH